MIYVLYGLAGSGKNYVGEVMTEEYGFHFFDGDQCLTEEMKQQIQAKQPFIQAMRDELAEAISQKLGELAKEHENVVIAQGLYKHANRQQIWRVHQNAIFICVRANFDVIVERLQKRGDHVDPDYAKTLNAHFEEEVGNDFKSIDLYNNAGKEEVMAQLVNVFPFDVTAALNKEMMTKHLCTMTLGATS